MTAFLVNLIGVLCIFFIIVWFWRKQKTKLKVIGHPDQPIHVTVADGVYHPDTIYAKANKPLELQFYRKDPSPCAETVIFDKLKISQDLPLNQVQSIFLNIDSPGEYEFTCQMGMYRGRLIVSE